MPLIKPTNNKAINVSTVPQRSPFRYPGGKTWLIPIARRWFSQATNHSQLFEPFAGGGVITLTAIAEGYFSHAFMAEIDEDMAAAWMTIFSDEDCTWLIKQIKDFEICRENISKVIEQSSYGRKEQGFATIVRNRTNHGGILAKGSGRIKSGESGKGISSRWYPETIANRISEANKLGKKITFIYGDAFNLIEENIKKPNAFFFIDPPYTVAGKRLYNH